MQRDSSRISGSLRTASTNTALVRAAAALAPDGVEVTVYDGLGDLPHFSPELGEEDAPAARPKFCGECSAGLIGVLICTPEYAFGMPGSLKNALDWLVTVRASCGASRWSPSARPRLLWGAKRRTPRFC